MIWILEWRILSRVWHWAPVAIRNKTVIVVFTKDRPRRTRDIVLPKRHEVAKPRVRRSSRMWPARLSTNNSLTRTIADLLRMEAQGPQHLRFSVTLKSSQKPQTKTALVILLKQDRSNGKIPRRWGARMRSKGPMQGVNLRYTRWRMPNRARVVASLKIPATFTLEGHRLPRIKRHRWGMAAVAVAQRQRPWERGYQHRVIKAWAAPQQISNKTDRYACQVLAGEIPWIRNIREGFENVKPSLGSDRHKTLVQFYEHNKGW